jgi:exodeoxyribonuclease V alpha subunit
MSTATASQAQATSLPSRLFPKAGRDLIDLYKAAQEDAGLLATDFHTIHDLLELSGYADQEPVHVMLLALLLALAKGSLCVEASEEGLTRLLGELVEGDGKKALGWAKSVVKSLNAGGFPELIGKTAVDGKPVVLHCVGETKYLYFQKYLKFEQELVVLLEKRLNERPAEGDWKAVERVFREVVAEPRTGGSHALKLNSDQKVALGLALARKFVIVSGGPGTGKTSIVFTLLRLLVRCGVPPDRIALAAPTGRAAQRMTDALRTGLAQLPETMNSSSPDGSLENLQAQTLHRLLGYIPSRGVFRHHSENPLPADFVIVDEVSMVGLELMARLFQATAPETTLVLLGDKDQLPSVEAGALLAYLVPEGREPCYSPAVRRQVEALLPGLALESVCADHALRDVLVVLNENYRSQKHIQDVARAVNAGQAEIVTKLERWQLPGKEDEKPAAGLGPSSLAELEREGGCWLFDPGKGEARVLHRLLAQWGEHHFWGGRPGEPSYADLVGAAEPPGPAEMEAEQAERLTRLFERLNRSRVLTLVREGEWGCVGINRLFDRFLRTRLDRGTRSPLFSGAPVLITRNDHARQLYNGDVGIALRTRERGCRVVFPCSGGFVAFPEETLPSHELACALTVHKSQGSEYNNVLLVLPPKGGRKLLTRELIYTGITRAKDLVVVCSPPETLRFAINHRTCRESALLRGLLGSGPPS